MEQRSVKLYRSKYVSNLTFGFFVSNESTYRIKVDFSNKKYIRGNGSSKISLEGNRKGVPVHHCGTVHFLLFFQVAHVVAINSCTPPPDLGGITSGDERVQIYVPPPQGTSYATINKRTVDAHKTITFLHYRQQSTLSLEEIQVHWHVTVGEGAGNDGEGAGSDGEGAGSDREGRGR